MSHTGKKYMTYTDDFANAYAFLQSDDIALALGNVAPPLGTPRLPHKLKPRRVSLRQANGGTTPDGAPTYTYSHEVVGTPEFAGLTAGATVTDGSGTWTVVAFRDEKNAALSAY
jgi:hypothetical protein